MSNVAISVEGLSKSYLVGHAAFAEPYTTVRDVLARKVRTLAGKSIDIFTGRPILRGETVEEFWALKDVSFEVEQGERIGIIGPNGSGKSTLLKVMSRITEPTNGRVRIAGRVASLLEVGTGFHPELTGRENIFLSGAILGMRRSEVLRKFDAIVAFSDIEKFLDTPVKRYSSGMYVRLGFAIAAHLEPEILVIDEVLAVGDAQFQKACLGRMQEVSGEGRTVIFVSHQLNAIQALCNRALLLRDGQLSDDGEPSDIVRKYLECNNTGAADYVPPVPLGDDVVQLITARVSNVAGEPATEFDVQDSVHLEMHYRVTGHSGFELTPNFRVFYAGGEPLFTSVEVPATGSSVAKEPGKRYVSRCSIPANLLNEGVYSITVVVSTVELQRPHVFAKDALSFRISDAMRPGGVRHAAYTGEYPGAIRPLLRWETTEVR